MNIEMYNSVSFGISRLITRRYSTSFSLATSLLEKEKRKAIYGIYGFVRVADEIVDSFHGYDQAMLLQKLHDDFRLAMRTGISVNPVLTSFVETVKKYNIDTEHVDAFMASMEADLSKSTYKTQQEIQQYIYGSADVVGLMCLKVFCNGDEASYNELKLPAQRLGTAFQKVNFLRDLKNDLQTLGRSYFPELNSYELNAETKRLIETSIEQDFEMASIGIRRLPGRSRLAVRLAYSYYRGLFNKIKRTAPSQVMNKRIRISNIRKYFIIFKEVVNYKFMPEFLLE